MEILTFSLIKKKYIWNYKFNNSSSSDAHHNEEAAALQFETDGVFLFLFRFPFWKCYIHWIPVQLWFQDFYVMKHVSGGMLLEVQFVCMFPLTADL